MRRSRWWAGWVALWLAASLFIWMFLASDGLDRAAGDDSGLDPEARRRAAEFADNWRHGLVGSPLFVPGFIVTAAAVALCDRQRSVRQLAAMGAAAIALGLGVAWVLAPDGTTYVASEFQARSGDTIASPSPRGGRGVLTSIATFVVFGILVVTGRRCMRDRTLKPLAVPGCAYVALAGLRGGGVQFGTLCRIWNARLRRHDRVAIASTMTSIGVSAAVLWDAHRLAVSPG